MYFMALQSGDQNLILLMVYILCLYYTFNRMITSIDDVVMLKFKKESVAQQLKEQNLENEIAIFCGGGTYSLEKVKDNLRQLLISIENKSETFAVYVDWDNSSWVFEQSKKSRRVIRQSPDMIRDLAIPQVPTIIAPKKTMFETVTAEDILKRNKESGVYEVSKPLVDIAITKGQRNLQGWYKDFMEGKKKIEFSLQLVLRISELRTGLASGTNIPPMSIINCPFTIEKLPWTYALPWNRRR